MEVRGNFFGPASTAVETLWLARYEPRTTPEEVARVRILSSNDARTLKRAQ